MVLCIEPLRLRFIPLYSCHIICHLSFIHVVHYIMLSTTLKPISYVNSWPLSDRRQGRCATHGQLCANKDTVGNGNKPTQSM